MTEKAAALRRGDSVSDGPEQRSPVDVWVERGLRRLYGDVVNEPIPEEWLKLIEADRKPK